MTGLLLAAARRVPSLGIGLGTFLRGIVARRELVREMAHRELYAGTAGHGLSRIWVYTHPLVIVLSYLVIFGYVIGTRIAVGGDFPGDYSSYILIGLVPWLATQAVLTRSTSALSGQSNLVKQVVFPIEVLPTALVVAVFATFAPAAIVVVAYKAAFGGGLPWTVLLLPVLLLLHLGLCLGLALLLSAVCPFVRDVREAVLVFVVVAMYFTPAIYLPQWVPAAILPVLYLNPFSYLVWCYQDLLFFGRIMHPFAWVVLAGLSAGAMAAGVVVFRRVKPFLGNVL